MVEGLIDDGKRLLSWVDVISLFLLVSIAVASSAV
jgi:hypothetical protein